MGAPRPQLPQFDSHRFVKRLTEAGLSEEAAEVLADEHAGLRVSGGVATKTVLDAIRAEMATKSELVAVRAEMATKEELAAVRAEIVAVRAEMVTKGDLRQEIAASEARIEQRLRNEILEARVSLTKWMITTMMVFSGVVIAAMTALR